MAKFDKLATRIGKQKAIVAIARKLLVVAWHVLTEQAADRHADPKKVAFKFMIWSWKLDIDHPLVHPLPPDAVTDR